MVNCYEIQLATTVIDFEVVSLNNLICDKYFIGIEDEKMSFSQVQQELAGAGMILSQGVAVENFQETETPGQKKPP